MSVTELSRNLMEAFADDHDDHDHQHEEDEEKASANTAKTITIVALFIISMASGMIPMLFSRWFNWRDPNKDPRTNLLISSLLSFGGGALFCTTFMHLLPEIDETIADLQSGGHLPAWEFSIANLLMSIGFFIIYLVEEIVHAYLRKRQAKEHEAFVRGHSARESLRNAFNRPVADSENTNNGVSSISTADLVEKQQHVHHNDHQHQSHNHHHHSHIPAISEGDDLIVSSIRGLLIVMALSVHELFEGLAVGLEQTTSNVWYMFGSVSAHKVVIAFCIGVELLVHKTKTWLVVLYIFVYAVVSPIGIGIGILLSNVDDSDAISVASVILQGLASGTLLYVIFFEILSKHKDGIIQYLAVVFGFGLMFGMKFIGKAFINSSAYLKHELTVNSSFFQLVIVIHTVTKMNMITTIITKWSAYILGVVHSFIKVKET